MSLTPDTGYFVNTTLNITIKIIVIIEIIKTFRIPTPAKRSIFFTPSFSMLPILVYYSQFYKTKKNTFPV